MLSASPEDLEMIRSTAEKFSYADLLRIANLLLRDDETVNRAEHQRLAVEIALLKAATFPRLKSVEQVLGGQQSAGVPVSTPKARASTESSAPPITRPAATRATPKKAEEENERPSTASGDTGALLDRIRKQRPLIAGYLESAVVEREGNTLTFVFDNSIAADSVGDAKDSIADVASEVFGVKMRVESRVGSKDEKIARADEKPAPLKDDPVLSAFRKHLGGELVKEKR